MVNRLLIALWLLLALSSVSSIANAAKLEAKLDSTSINMGDTVEFTFTVHDRVFGKAPDFSALNKDFEILSNRQSSQTSIINGEFTAYTRWVLTLLPKRTGFIAIPAIEYEGESTNAIKLRVTERKANNTRDGSELLFLDAVVDKPSVYVQEQLIYTIRVFKGNVDLYDTSFSSPSVDGAVMEQLGDRRQYRSTVNGTVYEVIEFKYAVFPQKSGEIKIPSAELIANVFQSRNRGFGMSPFNGKQVRRTSPELSVTVKAVPDSYPKGKPWLPARSLQLKEIWSPAGTNLKLGDPITRTVTMEAEGLTTSQLPPIPIPQMNTAKIYPEQADTSSDIGPYGIISKRVESQAIIPTSAGSLTLPSVEVTWWDVEEEKLKVTSLAPRSIKISGSSSVPQTDATAPTPAQLEPVSDFKPGTLSTELNPQRTWFWVAVIVAILWLATLLFFVFYVRQIKLQKNTQSTTSVDSDNTQASIKALWQELENACKKNDPHQARRLVGKLYQRVLNTPTPPTTDSIAQAFQSDELQQALEQLDSLLYKPNAQADQWNGSALRAVVKEHLQTPEQKDSKAGSLEPLYLG